MKKYICSITVLFSLLLLFAGCQVKEFGEQAEPSNIITAYIDNRDATKSQMGESEGGRYSSYWTEKDELAVYVDALAAPDKYTLASGAGTKKGSFRGVLAGRRYVALFPYSDKTPEGLKDNVLTLELPAVQTYVEGSFGAGAFPMLAVGEEESLTFKNLCSVLKVSMTGDIPVKSISFVAHDSAMAVSGKATVRTDFTDVPSLVMSEGGSPRMTLDCTSIFLDKDKPLDFYLVIPSGTYRGGFSIEVDTFSGKFERKITSDVTFARSEIRYIAPFVCNPTGEVDPDDIPYNQIWYFSDDDRPYNPASDAFDRTLVSNTFVDGKYILEFDGAVTEVKEWAFYSEYSITDVILPNSVKKIERYAFAATMIHSFRTPDQLESVEAGAFTYCNALEGFIGKWASSDGKGIVLRDGTLVAYLFSGENLVVPEGAIKLASNLFSNNNDLRHVTLSDGVQEIGDWCFAYCDNLETVYFPESVRYVNTRAFYLCKGLRKFEGNNAMLLSDRCLVNSSGTVIACATKGIEDFVFPEGVVSIDYFRLCDNDDIRSVRFPSSLRTLNQEFALRCNNLEFFYGPNVSSDHHCYTKNGNLRAVTPVLPSTYILPDEVNTIADYVFIRQNTLRKLIIPDKVTSVGNHLFIHSTSIQTLVLPVELKSIGYDMFDDCRSVDTLYFRSFAPPSYNERSDDAFFGHDGLVMYVPDKSEENYLASQDWKKYRSYFRAYHYTDLPGDEPDYYVSTDYSRDGTVTCLQKASEGAGIDLVLMGDGFTDVQIADGTYSSVMGKMAEAFFSEEPYTTLRPMFNVYSVDVVSATEGYDHPGQAFSCWFGEGTKVGGNDSKCMDYAKRIVGDDRMDNTLIIVAMNSTRYAGTCYMYYPDHGDYSVGTSVAYFPIGETDESLARIVHHEAGGHGFAKLDDEYFYESNGTIPEDKRNEKIRLAAYGWWKNIDFTDDSAIVKWSRFLTDNRYRFDGLGAFEGACTYWKGAWRPTENSIMRHNTGGYNAPSREAIWYRAHKLAYGESWEYDYEEFVKYDARNRKTSSSAPVSVGNTAATSSMPPLHPPVVIHRRWNEAVPDAAQVR